MAKNNIVKTYDRYSKLRQQGYTKAVEQRTSELLGDYNVEHLIPPSEEEKAKRRKISAKKAAATRKSNKAAKQRGSSELPMDFGAGS
jgi:hypothetical protein